MPEAWLTKVVTNLCLDRLRSARARRERAVGAWLPEPPPRRRPDAGPGRHVRAARIGLLAVLTLMERLSPVERAVYVLREAFSHSHAEIAEILDLTESASQQHLHRARRRVTAARRRGGEVEPGVRPQDRRGVPRRCLLGPHRTAGGAAHRRRDRGLRRRRPDRRSCCGTTPRSASPPSRGRASDPRPPSGASPAARPPSTTRSSTAAPPSSCPVTRSSAP